MKIFLVIVGAVAFFVALSAVLALPVMWLWNGALIGAIDGVHEVDWMQAWGITLLCGFLFKENVKNNGKN